MMDLLFCTASQAFWEVTESTVTIQLSSIENRWQAQAPSNQKERERKNCRIRTWISNVVWQSLAICQSGICHKASEMFGVLGRAVWASARHLGRLSGWHERGGRCDSEMRTTCRQHLLQQTVHSFIWILVYLTILLVQSILISFYLSLCDTMWLSIHQECMRLQDYSIFLQRQQITSCVVLGTV